MISRPLRGRRAADERVRAPTEWLEHLELMDSVQQTFSDLVIHVPGRTLRWRLPWTFSTFDYRRICALLREQSKGSCEFETAKVSGVPASPCTPTAATSARL